LNQYYLTPAKLRDMKGMLESVKESDYADLFEHQTEQNDRPLYEQIAIWTDQYDRQAAFYLDGTRAKVFVLIAVQKQAPYQVFTIQYTSRMKVIDKARRRYRFILNKVGRGKW